MLSFFPAQTQSITSDENEKRKKEIGNELERLMSYCKPLLLNVINELKNAITDSNALINQHTTYISINKNVLPDEKLKDSLIKKQELKKSIAEMSQTLTEAKTKLNKVNSKIEELKDILQSKNEKTTKNDQIIDCGENKPTPHNRSTLSR